MGLKVWFSLHIRSLQSRESPKYLGTSRGGARNLPTEGLELPTGGLKWLKMQFSYVILKNLLRQEPNISSDGGGGLDVSDGGM